jgi:hypothetical protein
MPDNDVPTNGPEAVTLAAKQCVMRYLLAFQDIKRDDLWKHSPLLTQREAESAHATATMHIGRYMREFVGGHVLAVVPDYKPGKHAAPSDYVKTGSAPRNGDNGPRVA